MRKTILFIIISILFCIGADWSRKPIIDPVFEKYEQEIEKNYEDCFIKFKKDKGKKSFIKRRNEESACRNKTRNELIKEGQLRGTEEYCNKKYGNLNFKALEKEFAKNQKQIRVARISPGDKKVPGELTYNILQIEGFWIESRLAKMQRKSLKQKEESMTYRKGWGKPKKD